MQPLPDVLQNFVDGLQRIKTPWIQYLQQFTTAPPPFDSVIVGKSPFEYTAEEPGNIYISGGIVTGITLTRGTDTLTLNAATQLIPAAVADVIKITYSVLPTVKFIPSYGVNTTNG